MLKKMIPYNLYVEIMSEKSLNGNSSRMFDVFFPVEVVLAKVPMYMAVNNESFQCLIKLSPHKANNAKVARDAFVKEAILATNFGGDRTNEKIIMAATGSMVKDATFSSGNGVSMISLGSRCAWERREPSESMQT